MSQVLDDVVAEAEEAVQETMLRAWRGAEGFGGRSALRSWLYRIAAAVGSGRPHDDGDRPVHAGMTTTARRTGRKKVCIRPTSPHRRLRPTREHPPTTS